MSGAGGERAGVALTEPDEVAGVEADDDVYVLVGDGGLVDVVTCGVGGEGYARQWILNVNGDRAGVRRKGGRREKREWADF